MSTFYIRDHHWQTYITFFFLNFFTKIKFDVYYYFLVGFEILDFFNYSFICELNVMIKRPAVEKLYSINFVYACIRYNKLMAWRRHYIVDTIKRK